MTPFNRLTPAEAERLALLSEELGEAQQAIGKILRLGYEGKHPAALYATTNRTQLEKELGDVQHAISRMAEAGDISSERVALNQEHKAQTITQYLHHQ
jgi:NTP pyrophosphatase (non-canonical NTP hydrolase)